MPMMNTGSRMSTIVPPAKDLSASPAEGLGEDAWIEVIQKMDEVYNDLLQYEVALEEKKCGARGVASVHRERTDLDVGYFDRLRS